MQPSNQEPLSQIHLPQFDLLVMTVDQRASRATPNDRLRHLLGLPAGMDFRELTQRFEIYDESRELIQDESLPWTRRSERAEFEEKELWRDRLSNRTYWFRVLGFRAADLMYIVLIDLSDQPEAARLANVITELAEGLYGDEDLQGVAEKILSSMMAQLKMDAGFISRFNSESHVLEMLSSIGIPEGFLKERRTIHVSARLLTAKAARTGELQSIPDLLHRPSRADALTYLLSEIGFRSCYAVPMIISGQVLGTVFLARKNPGYLDRLSEKSLLALNAGVSVYLWRFQEGLDQRMFISEILSIRETLSYLSGARTLRQLLANIVRSTATLLQARYGAIALLNADQTEIIDLITYGMTTEQYTRIGTLPSGRGLLGAVIREKKPIRVANIQSDARSQGFPSGHPEMRNFLGVPIWVGKRTFGNFYLTDKQRGEFTSADERLVELFAAFASILIDYFGKAEQAEEQRRQLDSIIHAAPSAILIMNAPDGRLTRYNALATRLFENLSTVESDPHWQDRMGIRHTDGRKCSGNDSPAMRALRGGIVQAEEYLIERPSGDRIPINVNAAPIYSDQGIITGAVVTIQDISKFKELDQMREEFTALIAHDLRNPIHSIRMQIMLLLKKASTKDVVVVPRSALELMERSAISLTQMADDLLDATRIQIGRLTLEPIAIPPSDWIASEVERFRSMHPNREIRLNSSPTESAIWADPIRLDQILSNLVENAAKYSPDGAPIQITLREVENGFEIGVQDFGMGIEPSDIPKLYDRFFQSKRAREMKSGLGLGLHITRGLVAAHQGTIEVRSALGKGSTFLVRIPRVSTSSGWGTAEVG